MEFLLAFVVGLTVAYAVACGAVSYDPSAPLWLRWPQPMWDLIAHDWRRPMPVVERPDYDHIARLERELGIVEPEPEKPIRPMSTVCLTKNCAGDTGEIYTWSGQLIARIHNCERP
ncbi:hypothetical protein ABZX82_02285 [Streptomyces griseoflavus]|uniref:hypothetical protein n=1 Tax=Streptomyces griseoflavus TaxID=35619 RepID=UPI0033B1AA4F